MLLKYKIVPISVVNVAVILLIVALLIDIIPIC